MMVRQAHHERAMAAYANEMVVRQVRHERAMAAYANGMVVRQAHHERAIRMIGRSGTRARAGLRGRAIGLEYTRADVSALLIDGMHKHCVCQ